MGKLQRIRVASSAYLEGPAFGGTLADECGKIELNSLVTEGEQLYREGSSSIFSSCSR
jgi:hypothetical protein